MSLENWRMSRRSFGRMLAAIVAASGRVVNAQVSKAVRRIGVLELGDTPDEPELVWRQDEPLRQRGWVEGKNLHVERRYGRPEAMQPLADELVRAQVELIVTGGTAATMAAKRATSTIPIVFRSAGDPVLLGLVASLARPGGNVTGYSAASPEMTAKHLSLLKELLPGVQRVGVLWWEGDPYNRATRGQFEQICKSLDLTPIIISVGSDIGSAIEQLGRQHAQALALGSGGFFWDHRAEIVDTATKHGLPTMTDAAEIVREAGALIGYASTRDERDGLRADYIDRVLRGARPGDLPVQQPTKFELVINLKTAKALGITIPQPLLLRADAVID